MLSFFILVLSQLIGTPPVFAGDVFPVYCSQRDSSEKASVDNLLDAISSGSRPEINSLDAVVGALPESMRKSFLFMVNSRSLQKSSIKSPRTIMYSPNADVAASFQFDGNFPGHEGVEMLLWNASDEKFELADIRRADGARISPTTPGPLIARRNPPECFFCHRNPPRPNWETPPFWAGLLPATESITANSVEAPLYIQTLKRVENKEPGFRYLVLPKSTKEIEQSAKNGDDSEIEVGHPEKIYGQYSRKNTCRITKELTSVPYFEKIKYLTLGAIQGCDITSFLPPWAQEQAIQYYRNAGLHIQGSANLLEAVQRDTDSHLGSYISDKIGRIFEFYRKIVNEKQFAEITSTFDPGVDVENHQPIANLRLALEPFGIAVNHWSMTPDSTSYAMAPNQIRDVDDGLPEELDVLFRKQPPFADIAQQYFKETGKDPKKDLFFLPDQDSPPSKALSDQAEEACNWLQSKSLTALAEQPVAQVSKALDPCNNLVSLPADIKSLDMINLAVLRPEVQRILKDNGCEGCHLNGVFGAPHLPYDNIGQLEKLIQDTKDLPGGGWAHRIWSRVSRGSDDPGRMPLVGNPLKLEDKQIIKRWLDSVTQSSVEP